MDTLAALEQELFQLAACAPSTQQQVELYVDMKRLRDRKESFIPCFCEGLVLAFGALNMPCEQMTAAALPLAENSEIDRDIVLHDIAYRSVVRHLDALQMLGQRLAVLVAIAGIPARADAYGAAAAVSHLARVWRNIGAESKHTGDAIPCV